MGSINTGAVGRQLSLNLGRVVSTSGFTIVIVSRLCYVSTFVFGCDCISCFQIDPGLGEHLPVLERHDIHWFDS